MPDDYDDYEDIFNQFKKFFKFDPKLFDIDFFILPEMGKQLDPKNKQSKGFKVSYHFETGMDEPEIKIEGDIDENKLNQYLKGFDFKKDPSFKILKQPNRKELIDASKIALTPIEQDKNSADIEPFTEVHDYNDYTQIIIEVPGIEKEDIKVELNDERNMIMISARNQIRTYFKEIRLPFKTSLKKYDLDVNNGIATLNIWRS